MKDNRGAFGFFLIFAALAGVFYWLFKRTGTAAQAAATPNPANGSHATYTAGRTIAPMGTTQTALNAGIVAGTGWLTGLFSRPNRIMVDSAIEPNPVPSSYSPPQNLSSIDGLVRSLSGGTQVPILQAGMIVDPYNAAIYSYSPASEQEMLY